MVNPEGNAPLLSPSHEGSLVVQSGIALEVIAARGYRTVTAKADLRRLGFAEGQRLVPALLIPLWGVTGEIVGYQSRPDTPRMKGGKLIKYETAAGMKMALDIHPSVRHLLADPGIPLFVTEGVKKGDALASRWCCAIALLGVWNWRGTNEAGGRMALAAWDSVGLNGRRVIIAFDSDVMLKPEVHEALARLGAFLAHRKAKVFYAYLPPGPAGTKVGVDDYLATSHTIEDLFALATEDLRLPERPDGPTAVAGPYAVVDGRICWLKRGSDGDTFVPLANFDGRIVGEALRDDGAEQRAELEIEGKLGDGRPLDLVRVPASQFAAMNWPVAAWGSRAVVAAGLGAKDRLREAIQLLSGDVPRRRVYTHIGWRRIGGIWAYIHSAGAIGGDGVVGGVEQEMEAGLARYRLPEPPDGSALAQAVGASLAILDLMPDAITVPLLAGAYRAALGEAAGVDFSEHVAGPTGAGKTELAALIQAHFGEFDSRTLPAGWASTPNALERLAFLVKDAVLVVDDFAPHGTRMDVARAHGAADRLLRAQGNRQGRARLQSDASARPTYTPRGLIISTGEDVPRGQSLRARVLALEVAPDALDWHGLTTAQGDAAAGRYGQAMAGFIRWLAPQMDNLKHDVPALQRQLRAKAAASASHRRTAAVVASLAVGWRQFLGYARDAGAIDEIQAEALWERAWRALGEASRVQASLQGSEEPTGRFLALLSAAIASGRAYVADVKGGTPEHAERRGWREFEVGSGDYTRIEWRPQGECVGWVDGDDLYLEPEAAFAAAKRLADVQGEALAITRRTMEKRMAERRLLANREPPYFTVRRVIVGERRRVLHVRVEIVETCTAETGPCGPSGTEGQSSYLRPVEDGPGCGPLPEPRVQLVGHEVGQQARDPESGRGVRGPLGPDGPQVATYPAKSPQIDGRRTVDDTWLTEPEEPMPWSEQV